MSRTGYTLVEILISVTLSLFLLLGVTELFRSVGTSISDTQATLNMTRNLHWVSLTLRNDLTNLTEDVNKPSKLNGISPPGDNGYFEIIEGQNVPYVTGSNVISTTRVSSTVVAKSPDGTNLSDNTVGDVDDILMFTARSSAESPFRGLINGRIAESTTAEIIWFMRGNTLYRRQLLVLDNNMPLASNTTAGGFYRNHDVSVRVQRDQAGAAVLSGTTPVVIANTLQDLSRRENRYGHWTETGFSAPTSGSGPWPYDVSQTRNPFPFPIYVSHSNEDTRPWHYLRLPILEECTNDNWWAGMPLSQPMGTGALTPTNATLTANLDAMNYPTPWSSTTTFSTTANPLSVNNVPYWDFWDNPNGWSVQNQGSGAIGLFVTNPRSPKTGEDIIMTNVLSFDVKVWNPCWVPTGQVTVGTQSNTTIFVAPQYVDLGQDTFSGPFFYWSTSTNQWVEYTASTTRFVQYSIGTGPSDFNPASTVPQHNPPIQEPKGLGFCSKGKYGGGGSETVVTSVTANPAPLPSTIAARQFWPNMTTAPNRMPMPSVYDTWTREYEKKPFSALVRNDAATVPANTIVCNRVGTGVDGEINDLASGVPGNVAPVADAWEEWECPPPYVTPLKGVEITIRCFDPRGKNIKQIRVVKDFL